MSDQKDNFDFDDDFLGEDLEDFEEEFNDLDDELDLDSLDDVFADSDEDDLGGQTDQTGRNNNKGATNQSAKDRNPFSLNFNTIVILCAVVVGAVVLFLQVTGEKKKMAANQEPRFVSTLGVEGATQDMTEVDVRQNTLSEKLGGFLNEDIDELPDDISNQEQFESLPMPAPVSDEMAQERESIADSLVFMTETSSTTPVSLSNIEDEDLDAPESGFDDFLEPQPENNENILESPESFDQDLANFDDDLIKDDVESKEEREQQNLSSLSPPKNGSKTKAQNENKNVNDMVLSAQTQDSLLSLNTSLMNETAQKIDRVLDRLNDLETKIDQVDQSAAKKQAALESSLNDLEKNLKSLKNRPTQNNQATPQKSVEKSVQKKRMPQWQLKAAQPGKAWIAKRGSNVIQSVVVGDQIEGLGRISSIRLHGNRWILVGSSGNIKQK